MHDHTANTLAGFSIALASIGGLFAQADPSAIGVWGSVIVLATLTVRAAQDIATRYITLQTAKIDLKSCDDRIRSLEMKIENQRAMAASGHCPLDPAGKGQPACLPAK